MPFWFLDSVNGMSMVEKIILKKKFKTVSSEGVAAVYNDWWENVPNSMDCVQEALNNYNLLNACGCSGHRICLAESCFVF